MFIDLNKEALALTINEMDKYLSHSNIDDNTLNKLLSNGSFSKLYTYFCNKLNSQTKADTNSNEGIWIKYNKGSDHMPLVKSLQGMATGWCTAGEATARSQLAGGDFYVYYTKDKDGNFKIPRLAIRMDQNSIAEIRGVAKNQNIESEMESVLDKKLDEFFDKDNYLKKVHDMKIMTSIYKKQANNTKLTKDELIFLYEIYDDIEGFGYQEDPRIEEVKSKRNFIEDLMIIFDCKKDNITSSISKLYSNPNQTVCFLGNIEDEDSKQLIFPNLRYISGNLIVNNLESAIGLDKLEVVGGIEANKLTSSKGLNNLVSVRGNMFVLRLLETINLTNLQIIKGDAYFNKLTSAKGLEQLRKIGQIANFSNLLEADGLKNLKTIGWNAIFSSLTSAKGLSNDLQIEGKSYFDSLENMQEIARFNKR